ncbi:MAG: hypothetical protein Q9222_003810 [Ikaeria aurantiellina]
MSSTEDTTSANSSEVDQSAQLRHGVELDSAGGGGPTDDELTEDFLDQPLSDVSSVDTQEAVIDTRDTPAGYQLEGSLQQEDVTTPVQASVPERPNKYHGPPSTWRSWTASERQLATSLDQLRASNLSIHLYNFHRLKREGDEIDLLHGERNDDRPTHYRKSWLPKRTWTAWPTIPDNVPRASDCTEWSAETYEILGVGRQIQRPSEVLQDLLLARACKKAKEAFLEREWEDAEAEDAAPVALEDDERSRVILQPLINHILGKLDTLLMGLHHARNSYATFHTEVVPDEDSEAASLGGKKRKRASSRASSTRRSRRRRRSSTGMPAHASGNDEATSRRSSRRRQRSSSVKDIGFGLRDWSDVLGVASMCGWDPAVVARATARCSDLFDEGIIFRTLDEGKSDHLETKYVPEIVSADDLQRAQEDSSQDGSSSGESGSERVGAVHVDGFLQPIEKQKSWGSGRPRPPGKKSSKVILDE